MTLTTTLCPGPVIEHGDGTVECVQAGCTGLDSIHAMGMSCGLIGHLEAHRPPDSVERRWELPLHRCPACRDLHSPDDRTTASGPAQGEDS
jgi:hypothetical protein